MDDRATSLQHQPPRWDHAPLEESYDGARALTMSVADRALRDSWEVLARHAGIPARRWHRFHPLGDRRLVQLVDGRPAIDATAWERFVSLAPGAVALPTRTADSFGVARSSIAPPDRRMRLGDLLGARRRRRHLRRAERTLDAELARDAARVTRMIDAALADGDDAGTGAGAAPVTQLPMYALAARIEQLLVDMASLQTPTLVDLIAADATAQLLRLLIDRGRTPDDALLEAARLHAGDGARVPEHLDALSMITMASGAEQHRLLTEWRTGVHGWHAMRPLLLESPPLRALDDADVLALATPQADRATPTDAELRDDTLLADAAGRARSIIARREQVTQARASIQAALRALTWTLAAQLHAAGALQQADDAFDLELHDLLRAARGATGHSSRRR